MKHYRAGSPGRAGLTTRAPRGLARPSAFFQRFGSSLSRGLGMLGAGGFLRIMAMRLAAASGRGYETPAPVRPV
jgi:hypothetical protein